MAIATVPLWQSAVNGIINFIEQTGQQALIQDVVLNAPKAGSTKSTRSFSTFVTVEKMAFSTKSGATTFDGVGTERVYELTGYMEYISGVNSEQVVLFDGDRFEIISVEDIGKIKGVLKLRLALLGDSSKEASNA